MKQLAEGVWHLNTIPIPNAINAFLVDDVLIDAGTRRSAGRLLRALGGRSVRAHALTHAHPDHQGSSHDICSALGIPFWVPENDVPAAEDPALIGDRQPNHPLAQLFVRVFAGPGHRVDRVLREGDEVGGFRVLDTPGHSAGHVCFWREADRVLILGDVVYNMNILTGVPGLRQPKPYLTPDPERNRESIRRLAALEPELVLFGHGPPLRDRRRFAAFCASVA